MNNFIDIYPIVKENYRQKISITLHQDNKLIKNYNDNISHSDLLRLINKILNIINNYQDDICHTLLVQKAFDSQTYALHIVFRAIDTCINQLLSNIIDVTNISILSYQIDKEIIYYTNNKFFNDNYNGHIWSYQIHSFIQNHFQIENKIHYLVNQWLLTNNHYLGLGGEMGYYALANKEKFQTFTCLTDNKYIYEDCCVNLSSDNIHLVNYSNIKLIDYIQSNDILLVNISKSGLRKLADQVNKLHFKQIVYISCSSKSFNRDNIILTNYQIVNKIRLKMFPQSEEWITIYDLRIGND